MWNNCCRLEYWNTQYTGILEYSVYCGKTCYTLAPRGNHEGPIGALVTPWSPSTCQLPKNLETNNLRMTLKIWNRENMKTQSVWKREACASCKATMHCKASQGGQQPPHPPLTRGARLARPKPWELTKETENWRLNCTNFRFCIVSVFWFECIQKRDLIFYV